MLRKVTVWRHVAVGFSIGVVALLAGFRVIGAGDDGIFRPEHFDAKQVTVSPAGADGVRIREVVDIDFGLTSRHGYERIVRNDFGAPTEVTASSPDADGDVNALDLGFETRIRIGDPNVTFTGQHRYVLSYTLPDARLSTGALALDVIGTDETFTTDRFEIVLTGFDLSDTRCDTGERGDFGGCTFERDATGNYVAVIEPLDAGEGITVGGTISALTAPVVPAEPAFPDRIPTGFQPLGLVLAALGVLVSGAAFAISRWYGSNEVASGGAAEAAFGALPAPGTGERLVPTTRVSDSRLAELATIEFVPPRGIAPWQGSVLLAEDLDDSTISAWFSEMVAKEAIVLREDGEDLRLEPGTNASGLTPADAAHIGRLFEHSSSIVLGEYSESFSSTWKKIGEEQRQFVKSSGWWKRKGLGGSSIGPAGIAWIVVFWVLVIGFVFGVLSRVAGFALGLLSSPAGAAMGAVLFVGLVASSVYATLLPARTATGSALALLTESFRRFLHASEGKHVQWAWDNGLLREYSAWAVALGEAGAWKQAIESSNIPDPDVALRGPLLVYTSSSAFHAARTEPSSSSSGGGGGGFSGGVGGGGGGGSSGSW